MFRHDAVKKVACLVLVGLLTGAASQAGVIHVKDPGEGNDIGPNLEAAWDRASEGDTILLPAGKFRIDGTIKLSPSARPNIHLKGAGAGRDGTKLHRNHKAPQNMIQFFSNGPGVQVSSICFQGFEQSNRLEGKGIMFMNTDFYLHDCMFSGFARAAVTVSNNTKGMGLISSNVFVDNHYAVIVNGFKDSWPPISPGTSDFLFIEDNYFTRSHHAVAGGEGALYVFRRNLLKESGGSWAVDMHGGRPSWMGSYTYSTRLAEVYWNTIYGGQKTEPWEITCRGGEALIWGNRLKGDVSIQLKPDGTWHGSNYWTKAPAEWKMPPYPAPYQIGWESGKKYGEDHTGTDPETTGAGDVFVWDNEFETGSIDVLSPYNVRGKEYDYIQKDRDYHFVKRPGYEPYTYPHPRRGISAAESGPPGTRRRTGR